VTDDTNSIGSSTVGGSSRNRARVWLEIHDVLGQFRLNLEISFKTPPYTPLMKSASVLTVSAPLSPNASAQRPAKPAR